MRFTDAELAAEYWRSMADLRGCMWVCRMFDYGYPMTSEMAKAKDELRRTQDEFNIVSDFMRHQDWDAEDQTPFEHPNQIGSK